MNEPPTRPDPGAEPQGTRVFLDPFAQETRPSLAATAAASRIPPPAGHEAPAFRGGEVLAERYAVVRLIARGGMGEVYEVEDRELDEHVALKTIRAHGLKDATATERFRREIQLARKVTHPNVCRIFELGYHQTGAEERILFLTMELLQGWTLSAYLRRQGRLSTAEALPLVRQMAEALGAAHDVNVIHRDFKGPNVMLVPSGKPRSSDPERREGSDPADRELRVVVTDFGLARQNTEETDSTHNLTGSQIVLGTPATMAPEQVTGEPVGPETDLYALGIVMYEMLTGSLPFKGAAREVMYQRLTQDAPSPRLLVPDLDPRWEAAILRCLERKPTARFRSSAALLHALESQQSQPWSTVQMRRAVGVLGFKNLTQRPDSAWLSTAFSEMLGTELATGERLRVATGENVAQMKLELALREEDSYSGKTLLRIRQSLGVDFVVFGSYLALGSQLRLDLRLQDTARGETLVLVQEKGPESELFELIARAGTQLRQRLGVEASAEAASGSAHMAMPAQPEAARLYSEGLNRLRAMDHADAKNLLEAAVAAEADFPLAHAALAEAWHGLGYEKRELDEIGQAFELSAELPREERLKIEARHRMAHREWDKAIELYQALFTFYPDDVEHGLQLAAALAAAQQRTEALDTLRRLQQLPLQPTEHLRIEIRENELELLHRNAQWLEARARRLIEKAEALGSPFLIASARAQQASALWRMGEKDRAVAGFEAARQIYTDLGNAVQAGKMLQQIGNVLGETGDQMRSQQHYEAFLELCRKSGNRAGERVALHALCAVVRIIGDLNRAWQLYQEAQKIAFELGEHGSINRARNQEAVMLIERGELREARKVFEQLLDDTETQKLGHHRIITLGLYETLLRCEGNLEESRKVLQACGELAEQLGDAWLDGSVRHAHAEILLEDGRPEEARQMTLQALQLVPSGSPHEATFHQTLAQSELECGRRAEALEAIERAEALRRKTGCMWVPIPLTAALIRAASGRPEDRAAEIEVLKSLLEETTKTGWIFRGLELRLGLGKLELQDGRTEAGRSRLEALEREARERGFGGIARDAAKLLRGETDLRSPRP